MNQATVDERTLVHNASRKLRGFLGTFRAEFFQRIDARLKVDVSGASPYYARR